MSGRVTVLTPQCESEAIELGRHLWKKQILPIGSLKYKGRVLNFTKEYLKRIADSFKARAFDAVPFQFAGPNNEHNNDPERTRGDIVGLEVADDGLYAALSATDQGDAYIREYPKFGVSVRLVEEFERGPDGAKFPVAMQHLLGTWDPRISGMKPWTAVECSNETVDVIDLSALTFTPDGNAVPAEQQTPADTGEEHNKKEATPVAEQLTEEELAQFRAALPLFLKMAGGDGDTGDPVPPTQQPAAPPAPQFTQAELDDVAAPAESDESEELESVAAANDDETGRALELANARLDELAVRNARLEAREAERAYTAERDYLAREHGVPPLVTDLCRSWLTGENTVELSNGTQANPGEDIRKALKEFGSIAKLLDLSSEVKGSPLDSGVSTEADEAAAFLKAAHDAGFAH